MIEAFPIVAPQFMSIRGKRGIQRIDPRPLQLHYQKTRQLQEIILKARQGGVSTWKELEGLMLMMTVPGFMGAIISHKISSTKYLLSIVWNAYKMMDEKDRVPLVHETEEYLITPPPPEGTGAGLWVGTAGPGAADFARSRTLHWCHGSEVAFWNNAEDVLAAVEGSLPQEGYLCLESTPNGRNHFYDLYQEAAERGLKRHFFPWWWVPEYKETVPDGMVFVRTEDEVTLITRALAQGFDLTDEHLLWRRHKKARLRRQFEQEYPEDEQTCFIVSGNPRFEIEFLAKLIALAEARPPFVVEAKPYGELRTWFGPVGDHIYAVGADPSQGLSHGDYGAAVVYDCHTNQHVASLHCKIAPHMFAREIANLGEKYNKAMLTVERNGPGEAVLEALHHIGYPNLYTQTRWYDGRESGVPGFYTDATEKERLCASFESGIISGKFQTYDVDLLDQMMNVMIDDRGRIYTSKNKRDDLLMAAMLVNLTADEAGARNVAVGASFAGAYFGV